MKARVFREDDLDVWSELSQLLCQGEVVALPTETVYGLAADARNEAALHKIFEAKGRPLSDPLIVHVSERYISKLELLQTEGLVDLKDLTQPYRDLAQNLMNQFWPGPLSILLPRGKSIPGLVTAGRDLVALRCPDHPLFQKVLATSGCPLAAPSANRFGRISPTSAEDVFKELGDRIPAILDGGPCRVGVESTVVALSADGRELSILRAGGVAAEDLAPFVDKLITPSSAILEGDSDSNTPQIAPGQLLSHYAPRKKCVALSFPEGSSSTNFSESFLSELGRQRIAFISARSQSDSLLHKTALEKQGLLVVRLICLSPSEDDREVARRLFSVMRKQDESSEIDTIVLLLPTSTGKLWQAISDRMMRAASGVLYKAH